MKTLTRKQILGYTAFSAAAGLLLAIVRAVVSMVYLEPGVEMYAHGTPLPAIMHGIILLCGIAVCTSAFRPLCSNSAAKELSPASQFTLFASMFCGFLLLAYDLYLIYDVASAGWDAIGPLIGRPPSGTVTMASAVFTLCLMIFAVPAAIYFLKAAQGVIKPSHPFFATMTVVWFVLFALHAYFDAAIAFNSPTKVLRILTVLTFAIYAIHETRRTLDIPMPRIYFPSAFLAIFLGLTHALSDAVLLGSGKIILQEGYLGIAVELAYVLYILSRVLYLGTTKPTAAVCEAQSAPQQ
ncbi:MAG: hypothetical protein E7604_06245 [Ruminococcaceae bacterium]|nr:hypothetical protein [Oscillospiraceae bacterium]